MNPQKGHYLHSGCIVFLLFYLLTISIFAREAYNKTVDSFWLSVISRHRYRGDHMSDFTTTFRKKEQAILKNQEHNFEESGNICLKSHRHGLGKSKEQDYGELDDEN